MAKSKPGLSRGVLNRKKASGNFQVARYQPSSKTTFCVEHYWIVRWNLRGKDPFRQDVLSHPSVHLVFERDNTKIWGVVTGKFTRVLEGKGQVLGIKFRPGAFFPFIQQPVASFADDILAFEAAFDDDLERLEKELLCSEDDELMVEQAEAFLRRHLPERDPKAEETGRMVECIMSEQTILKVDDLAERFGCSKRTLQRLFRQYVGASPKWVIQRYRLHEAAERMADSEADNWPQLALDLGYFDQSHFIRDFKAIVGMPPAEYAQTIRSES